jgi:hypothetical protein
MIRVFLKFHKPYEFGAKIGFATLPGANVIVGVAHFQGNQHDLPRW